MANMTISLASRLDWRAVLPSLGVARPGSPFLPQVVQCPRCSAETLDVMADRVMGGQWFHCPSCHLTDDAIGLAAATWRTDAATAIVRLEGLGFFSRPLWDSDVECHIRDHVQYRQRFTDFWDRARQAPMLGTDCPRSLLREFALVDNYWQPTWLEQGGLFFGTATRKDVEELFAPDSFAPQERKNRNGKSSVRRGPGPGFSLFPGHGWDHLIVVPFYDLPGRISGLMMVGRDADPDKDDFIFRPVNRPGTKLPREVGLGMLPSTTWRPHRILGDTVFVVSDVQVGMKLQGRHLRDSRFPLPIVLMHETCDLQLLHLAAAMSRRQLIFWGPTQKVLPAAKRHGGSVSNFEISAREIDLGLKHRLPQDWLRLVRKKACPWGVAMRRAAEKLDSASLQRLVTALDLSPEEYRRWFTVFDDAASERVARCAPFKLGTEVVRVRGRDVFESERGWELSSGESLCNQPIRIEQSLTTGRGESFYRVAVGAADPVHFTVALDDAEKNGLFAVVSRELRKTSDTEFVSQPSWNKDALFIALSFHRPKRITGCDRIGWNRAQLRVQFPHFAIHNGGHVIHEPLALTLGHDELPGQHLNPPGMIPPVEGKLLSESTPGTQLVWALAAGICHNILVGVAVRHPCGLILDGEFAQETGPLAARALGCAETDTSARKKGMTIIESILDAADRHGWPALIRFSQRPQHKVTSAWLDSPGIRNCILPLNRYAALVTGTYGGFARINAGDRPLPLGPLQRAARQIVVHYLRYIVHKKRGINCAAAPGVMGVLKDISGWFEDIGGNPRAVLRAKKILFFDDADLATTFVELVTRMYVWGDIRYAHVGWDTNPPERPATLYYQDASGDRPAVVGVRPEGLNRILHEHRSVALDTGRVRASLEQHGAWAASVSDEHGEVWLIDMEWWQERAQKSRRRLSAA